MYIATTTTATTTNKTIYCSLQGFATGICSSINWIELSGRCTLWCCSCMISFPTGMTMGTAKITRHKKTYHTIKRKKFSQLLKISVSNPLL